MATAADFPEGTIVLRNASSRSDAPFLTYWSIPMDLETWCPRHTSQLWIPVSSLYRRSSRASFREPDSVQQQDTVSLSSHSTSQLISHHLSLGGGQGTCWNICEASRVLGTSVLCANTNRGLLQCQELKSCTCFSWLRFQPLQNYLVSLSFTHYASCFKNAIIWFHVNLYKRLCSKFRPPMKYVTIPNKSSYLTRSKFNINK